LRHLLSADEKYIPGELFLRTAVGAPNAFEFLNPNYEFKAFYSGQTVESQSSEEEGTCCQ
jgi:hypothetical protein